jgi:uncharacterized membrane protein
MVSLDYTTLRAKLYPAKAKSPNLALLLERLFLAWISAVAALIFLFSIVLAAFGLMSLMQLFYTYVSISLITIALASALYCARRNLPHDRARH